MEGQAQAICLKVFDGGKPVELRQRRRCRDGRSSGRTNSSSPRTATRIGYGRNISPDDVELGRSVTVVGASIQKKLFPSQTADRQDHQGQREAVQIIGVLDGEGLVVRADSQDDLVLVPITKFFSDFGHEHRTINSPSSRRRRRRTTRRWTKPSARCAPRAG